MNSMNYRGYTARIDFDDRDNIFVGRVLGLPATVKISFHGETVAEPSESRGQVLQPCKWAISN
jgi:predicted HicB family RNase H-like nuclease